MASSDNPVRATQGESLVREGVENVNVPNSLFRSHATILIEAASMEEADCLLGEWLDHAENALATWVTSEVPEDER